jgi:hypothetical protein
MTMKKLTFITAAILLFTAAVGWQSCQSTKSSTATKMLKFNLEKGKGYDYELNLNMDQEVMGQRIEMDMGVYYSMNVVDDNGTDKTISTSIDRFKMKTAAGGMNMEIDTDKPFVPANDSMDAPLQMMNRVFSAIKGKKFTMTVNAEGKVQSVTGFENMASSLIDSLDVPEDKKAQIQQQFEKQFNGEQMKGQLERVWYIFPNKEVKVGDTWTRENTVNGDMPGKYTSTYKVKEIEGDMVTLDETTRVESQQEKINISGDITGTMVIDSKLGLIVTADQDMKLKASAGQMNFEIKGKTKVKGTAR